MTKNSISSQHHQTFESIKIQDDADREYRQARQLAKMLEYIEYRHFLPVIAWVKETCGNSRHAVENHIEDILDMVEIGSDAKREIQDIRFSRYACYLIVQNGDPSKTVIANGNPTSHCKPPSEAERPRALCQNQRRRALLMLRNELTRQNKDLAVAAEKAGEEKCVVMA